MPARFTVTEVKDGDTFRVSPLWGYHGRTGDVIRIADFYAPELNQPGGVQAKLKLSNLILDKRVELRNYQRLSYGRLVCDVLFEGRNIRFLL